MTCYPRNTLQLALVAALAARRPRLVRYLLSSQGNSACALEIAAWSLRQIADVLSILPRAEQAEIFMRLPFSTRARLLKMGISGVKPLSLSGTAAIFDKLKNWFSQALPFCSLGGMCTLQKTSQFCFNKKPA